MYLFIYLIFNFFKILFIWFDCLKEYTSLLSFFLSLVDMLLDTKELPHLLAREIFDSLDEKNWTMILFHLTMDEDETFWSPIHPMVKFPLSSHQMMEIIFDRHPMAKIPHPMVEEFSHPMVKIAFTHHQINGGDWFWSPRKE
jgi:hypothetical protein